MTIKLDHNKKWAAVAYTDGGTRPNPGHMGFGIHGYLFEDVESTKPIVIKNNLGDSNSFVVHTNRGYIESTKEGKYLHNQKEALYYVEPLYYLEFSGSGDSIGTNNMAELRAYYHILTALKESSLHKLHLICDSEYTLKGIDSRLAGKVYTSTPQYSVIPNAEMWERLMDTHRQLTSLGTNITHSWQKGHAGNFGNTNADWLATIGVFKAPDCINANEFKFHPAKKYWDVNVERHPFLNFKRIYFNREREYNVPGQYYAADPGGVDEHIGKRTPDSGYAVIRLNTPDKVIESIRERQFDYAQGINSIMMLKVDKAFSKEIYPYVYEHGKYCLSSSYGNNANIVFLDKTPVTVDVNPMGLMMRTLDNLSMLEELLDKFLHYQGKGSFDCPSNNQQIKAHDITDIFYHPVEKKVGKTVVHKAELKPEFVVGYRNHLLHLDIPHLGSTETIKVPLVLGIDLPPRNNLKQIESETPKVYLISWKESEYALRYCTVIQMSSGIGIWSNFYADRIFLQQPKA